MTWVLPTLSLSIHLLSTPSLKTVQQSSLPERKMKLQFNTEKVFSGQEVFTEPEATFCHFVSFLAFFSLHHIYNSFEIEVWHLIH